MRKADDAGQPISSSLIALACANPLPPAREGAVARPTQASGQALRGPPASPGMTARLRESPRQTPRAAQPYGAETAQIAGALVPRTSRRAAEPAPRHGRGASMGSPSAGLQEEEEVGDDVAENMPADGSKLPDVSKWNWVPCENRPELLQYHDGKKRWFHCSKCEYWNDRLYHTKMHYERIHVKQGRSMPRKRKYVEAGDQADSVAFRSPNKRPAAEVGSTVTPHRHEAGKKASMETPKGKSVQSTTNKSTPPTKPINSGMHSPTKGKGQAGSKHSTSKGSSTGSPSGPAAKRALDSPVRAAGPRSKMKSEGELAARVFVFGSLFFQDKGPRLAFDVASLCKPSKRRGVALKAQGAIRRGKDGSPKKGEALRGMIVSHGGVGQKRGKIVGVRANEAATGLGARLGAMHAASPTSMHGQDARGGRVAKLEPSAAKSSALSAGDPQAESSSGLSDTSQASSPVRRPAFAPSHVFAPSTPVHQRPLSLRPERSPGLGDGMQALDGMQGLSHGEGSMLAATPVPTSERRQAYMFSDNLGLTSAPDSSPSKMYAPSSPPIGAVMSDISAIPPMSGGCPYDASPSRHQYNLRSPPMTPTTGRCWSNCPQAPSGVMSVGHVRPSVTKREGSSEIFSALHSLDGNIDNMKLLCSEFMGPEMLSMP